LGGPGRGRAVVGQALDLAVTAWAPLGAGLLTGRYGSDRPRPEGTRIATTELGGQMLSERNLSIADALNSVAAERGASPAQVAIAWVRAQQRSGVVIPIVGARRLEQVKDSLGAVDVDLAEDELEQLDAVSRIELGFPHDFSGRAYAYGDTFHLVDHHRRDVYTELDAPPQAVAAREDTNPAA
jgi:aryl-alcohol dehydrogenase-like predicted oxidoreductase